MSPDHAAAVGEILAGLGRECERIAETARREGAKAGPGSVRSPAYFEGYAEAHTELGIALLSRTSNRLLHAARVRELLPSDQMVTESQARTPMPEIPATLTPLSLDVLENALAVVAGRLEEEIESPLRILGETHAFESERTFFTGSGEYPPTPVIDLATTGRLFMLCRFVASVADELRDTSARILEQAENLSVDDHERTAEFSRAYVAWLDERASHHRAEPEAQNA